MSMSKFASGADYWKARAEQAEAKLTELDGQEPVAWIYDWMAPEGLIQDWVETNRDEIPEGATNIRPLYARPAPAEPVNARLLNALKLAECVYRKNVVNEGEPSYVLEAMQAAITAAEAQRPTDYSSTVDRAWVRFCGAFGDGPDAPYPGMIAAFETQYGQSFRDKAWRIEAACWAAAWRKATEQASRIKPPKSGD